MPAVDSSKYEQILIESNDRSTTVDLRLGVQSIDYYEDIFSPTITAKIVVTNTGNTVNGQSIYQGLPLRGGERLALKIAGNTASNPGLEFGNLYVSSISNVLSKNQNETFVLNLCSREAITNETARVVKKYPTSSPISASAEDIIKSYLQTSKNVSVDPSSNKYGFIGNMRKPFTVLTWLASKGVPDSKGDATAGYVFYETQEGYNFRSLDKLITQQPKATYNATEIANPDSDRKDFEILSYITNRNQNMLEKLRLGAYASQRMFFNPLNFSFTLPEKGLFKIDDYSGKSKNLGETIKLPKISEDSEKTLGEIPTRMITGIVDIGTMEEDVSTDENADPLKYQSQALMRYNVLFTQTLTATVPLNTNLMAGNIIKCLFPKTTTDKNKEYDQDQSGLYMIKELCHHFDTEGSYTSMKLIRDTFGQYGNNNEEG
jgi:hypothetical protein